MVYLCCNLLFYAFSFIILISNIECHEKTRGQRSPQTVWLYDQKEYTRDGSQPNRDQTNNNTYEIIVFEAPRDNQTPLNGYQSAELQPIILQATHDMKLLSLLYDGKLPQITQQANLTQDDLKLPPLKIDPKYHDEGQTDKIKWESRQQDVNVKNGGHLNTERDLSPSVSWRQPPSQPSDNGPAPTSVPDDSSLNVEKPPHSLPSDTWKPPPASHGSPSLQAESDNSQFNEMIPPHPPLWYGTYPEIRYPPPQARGRGPPPQTIDRGPPSHAIGRGPPPHDIGRGPPPHVYRGPPPRVYRGPPPRVYRGPPPRGRGRGPPPHVYRGPPPHGRDLPPYPRGRGPPPKEFGPPRPNWDRQDPVHSNNNNAVYDRNQGRGIPLTNNPATDENIQQSTPQEHLFQVVPVTPEI